MEIAHYIDILQIDRQLDIIGKHFSPFKEPDINNYYIKPVLLDFLADAYENAGRLEDSAKTRAFILMNFQEKTWADRSLPFFVRHPQFADKYKLGVH
jgi:hypothetical protein